jgi:hypothetical protein
VSLALLRPKFEFSRHEKDDIGIPFEVVVVGDDRKSGGDQYHGSWEGLPHEPTRMERSHAGGSFAPEMMAQSSRSRVSTKVEGSRESWWCVSSRINATSAMA